MYYRAHIYRRANFKTTVGRRLNFIEYLRNATVQSQTDTCNHKIHNHWTLNKFWKILFSVSLVELPLTSYLYDSQIDISNWHY